jgi:hypothetical protein
MFTRFIIESSSSKKSTLDFSILKTMKKIALIEHIFHPQLNMLLISFSSISRKQDFILDRKLTKIIFNNLSLICKSFKVQMNNKTSFGRNNMNIIIRYNKMKFKRK